MARLSRLIFPDMERNSPERQDGQGKSDILLNFTPLR